MVPQDRLVKVMIGRFQPFHNGHLRVLRAAIATSSRVIIVIGSAGESGTTRNPWGVHDRRTMIFGALAPEERTKVSILSQIDMPDQDQAWRDSLQAKVEAEAREHFPAATEKIGFTLVGCYKNAENYYLDLYPDWNRDLVPAEGVINATDIRLEFFTNGVIGGNWESLVPPSTYAFLHTWRFHRLFSFIDLKFLYKQKECRK